MHGDIRPVKHVIYTADSSQQRRASDKESETTDSLPDLSLLFPAPVNLFNATDNKQRGLTCFIPANHACKSNCD